MSEESIEKGVRYSKLENANEKALEKAIAAITIEKFRNCFRDFKSEEELLQLESCWKQFTTTIYNKAKQRFDFACQARNVPYLLNKLDAITRSSVSEVEQDILSKLEYPTETKAMDVVTKKELELKKLEKKKLQQMILELQEKNNQVKKVLASHEQQNESIKKEIVEISSQMQKASELAEDWEKLDIRSWMETAES